MSNIEKNTGFTRIKMIQTITFFALVLFMGVWATAGANAASVKLSKTKVTLEAGMTTTLKVTGTKAKVKWTSKNKKIASVTKKGKVTAKKKGTTYVIASVAKKKLRCKVTVKQAMAKPLTKYWAKDSAAAKNLKAYVGKVTNAKDKKNFIPAKDRIAVFDMDGTLTCETYFTYFDTMMFIEYCLTDYPDKVSDELKNEAKSIKPGYVATKELAMKFAKAYAGMTVQELYEYAEKFGNKETKSFYGMRFFDGFYLPMTELVKYLYENDFTIYVVSGTERTTTRAIVANSPISEYVPPRQVIGTEFEVKQKGHEGEQYNMDYKYADGDELVITGGFLQKNLNANKCIYIEREIGKRPVLAFGNSGSDSSMLNYAIDKRNKYPAEAYMLVADDSEREWGKESWEEKSKKYKEQGYTPISMKDEFAEIYPETIVKAKQQYSETEQQRAANPMKVAGKTASVKYKVLKKKNQTIAAGKAYSKSGAQGKVVYQKVKVNKAKVSGKFAVDRATGKITVKKGLAKGTYKMTVKVSDLGTADYQPASSNATVTIKVK